MVLTRDGTGTLHNLRCRRYTCFQQAHSTRTVCCRLQTRLTPPYPSATDLYVREIQQPDDVDVDGGWP